MDMDLVGAQESEDGGRSLGLGLVASLSCVVLLVDWFDFLIGIPGH